MRPQSTVFLLDHRGSGLAQRYAPLEQAGLRLEVSESVRRSLERLAGPAPDVLVLDPLVEGGAVELEALDRAGGAEIPLLLLVDPSRIAEAHAAMVRGTERAVDWAHRDATADEIRVRVERLLALKVSRAELAELRHRALYDDRTELLRPEAFERRVAEHWSAAERHGHPLALVIADLDRFGQFNKRYDHTVGDRVLSRVGEAIRSALRTEDVAGRLGGDEFGCLLPYTQKADAARVVKRLCEEIRAVTGKIGGAELAISASIGFETFDGRDVESVEALRRHAEAALHEAKRRGGDRAVYYRLLPPPPTA